MSLIDRLVMAVAVVVYGVPTPQPRDCRAHIPSENPLEESDGSDARREAALRMMDEDCYGFLLLTVHKETGSTAKIRMAEHLDETWWPAMAVTLEQVAAEVPR